jgi:hypothetical protein
LSENQKEKKRTRVWDEHKFEIQLTSEKRKGENCGGEEEGGRGKEE